jgi:hypothetical protein
VNQALIELHYFPSTVWMAQLLRFEELGLEAQEYFQKQSYRNRCEILSANGVLSLSIPTLGSPRQAIQQIQIDQSQRWQDRHWRSIYSAYGKAPFFEFFAEDIRALIYQREAHLWNFNLSVLSKCLQLLQIKAAIVQIGRAHV